MMWAAQLFMATANLSRWGAAAKSWFQGEEYNDYCYWISADGTSWEKVETSDKVIVIAPVVWDGTKYYGCYNEGGVNIPQYFEYTSDDLTTWTKQGVIGYTSIVEMAGDSSTYYVGTGSSSYVRWSKDLKTWKSQSSFYDADGNVVSGNMKSVATDGAGKFVLVGQYSTIYDVILYSE